LHKFLDLNFGWFSISRPGCRYSTPHLCFLAPQTGALRRPRCLHTLTLHLLLFRLLRAAPLCRFFLYQALLGRAKCTAWVGGKRFPGPFVSCQMGPKNHLQCWYFSVLSMLFQIFEQKPKHSMYGLFTYIYHKNQSNVGAIIHHTLRVWERAI